MALETKYIVGNRDYQLIPTAVKLKPKPAGTRGTHNPISCVIIAIFSALRLNQCNGYWNKHLLTRLMMVSHKQATEHSTIDLLKLAH